MIGNKIRELRKGKNYTMQELADKIHVTQGYISQIERGMIDPSLSVVRKISEVLGVPIVSLFAEDNHGKVVVIRKDERKILKFKESNVVYEFLTPFTSAEKVESKMEMLYVELQPKSWGSEEVMIHDADECVFVLEGTIEYHINDEIYTVRKFDSIYIPEKNFHRLYNPGDEVAKIVGAITPPLY